MRALPLVAALVAIAALPAAAQAGDVTQTAKSGDVYFGNYGYKVVDLNHDGMPELSAYDERFAYAFGSYADSCRRP